MRFGCCFGVRTTFAASLRDAGFDYGETCIRDVMSMDNDAFLDFRRELDKIGLPIESGCVFLVGGLYVNRLQRDFAVIDDYLDRTVRRCSEIGMKTIVFGSGGARAIPEGLTEADVFDDLVVFLREHVLPRTDPAGMRIAIEPLSEPCCIRTVGEALALSDAVGSESVQVLADNFHMVRVDDPLESIRATRGRMIHAHISRPRENGRRTVPMHGDGYDPYPFMKEVFETGCQRLSIEANTRPETFWDESHDAILLLRETLQRIESEAKTA